MYQEIAHFHSSSNNQESCPPATLSIVYIYLFVIDSLFIIAISFIFTLIDQFGIVDNLSRKHRIWRRLFVHVLGYQVFLLAGDKPTFARLRSIIERDLRDRL